MIHPDEQTIERIAMALIELGFSEDWDREARVPVELAPSLEHLRDCAHCREILEIFIETETAWRAAADSSARVIPLRPFRSAAPAAFIDDAWPEEVEEYLVAAADASTRPPQSRVLTLMTDDDRYLVRIFPNLLDEGATAILVSLPAEGIPAVGSSRPALRIAGVEYEFDDGNIARLPCFPSSDLSLVVRDET